MYDHNKEMNPRIVGKVLSCTGKDHEKREVFDPDYSVATIPATSYKDPPKIIVIDTYNHRDITDKGICGTLTVKSDNIGHSGAFAVVETKYENV